MVRGKTSRLYFAFLFQAAQRAFLAAHLRASRSWRLMLASWLVSDLLFIIKRYRVRRKMSSNYFAIKDDFCELTIADALNIHLRDECVINRLFKPIMVEGELDTAHLVVVLAVVVFIHV
jgi:hypothetical protein